VKSRTRLQIGRRDTVHTIRVNAPAITASATPACAARADTAPSASAPLELPLDASALPAELAAEGDSELEGVVASDGTAPAGDWDGTAKEGEAEPEPEAGAGEVLFEPVPPGRYDGGATALEGSTRAPLPQGIPSPSGWVRFGAGTVVPLASAMAKRPVQR
jgi:hypothetical protein